MSRQDSQKALAACSSTLSPRSFGLVSREPTHNHDVLEQERCAAMVEEVANEVLRLRLQKSQHEELRAQLTRAEAQVRRLSTHTVIEFRHFLERHLREPTLPAQVQEALGKLVECLCFVFHIEISSATQESFLAGVRKMLRTPYSFGSRLCAVPPMSMEEAKSLAPVLLTTTQFRRVREKEVNECYEAIHSWLSAFYLMSMASEQAALTCVELERQEATLLVLTGQTTELPRAEDVATRPSGGKSGTGHEARNDLQRSLKLTAISSRGAASSPGDALRRSAASLPPKTGFRRSTESLTGSTVVALGSSRSPSPGLPGGGSRPRYGAWLGHSHTSSSYLGRGVSVPRQSSPSRNRRPVSTHWSNSVATHSNEATSQMGRGRSRGTSMTRQQSDESRRCAAPKEFCWPSVSGPDSPSLANVLEASASTGLGGHVSTAPSTPAAVGGSRRTAATPDKAAPTSRRTAVHEWRTSGFQRSDSVGPGLHRNRSGKSGKSVEPDRSARGGKTEAPHASRYSPAQTRRVADAEPPSRAGLSPTIGSLMLPGTALPDGYLARDRSSVFTQRRGTSPARHASKIALAALVEKRKRAAFARDDTSGAVDTTPRSPESGSTFEVGSACGDPDENEEVEEDRHGRRLLCPETYKALFACAQKVVAAAGTGCPPPGPDDPSQ